MAGSPMYSQYPDGGYRAAPVVDVAAFMNSVYRWMALGLGLTGLVAMGVVSSPSILSAIFQTPHMFTGLLIVELIMVFVFSASVRKVSFGTAAAMFLTYCAMSGLTFSVFFLAYTRGSIAGAFYVTGGTFAAMSAYGTITKKDLSGWGNFLLMGLFGIIIAGIVNMFMQSSAFSFAISAIAVVIFTGLTAYDTQKIRAWAGAGDRRLALLGALELYLDFINLFIALLRLFGRRR